MAGRLHKEQLNILQVPNEAQPERPVPRNEPLPLLPLSPTGCSPPSASPGFCGPPRVHPVELLNGENNIVVRSIGAEADLIEKTSSESRGITPGLEPTQPRRRLGPSGERGLSALERAVMKAAPPA